MYKILRCYFNILFLLKLAFEIMMRLYLKTLFLIKKTCFLFKQ